MSRDSTLTLVAVGARSVGAYSFLRRAALDTAQTNILLSWSASVLAGLASAEDGSGPGPGLKLRSEDARAAEMPFSKGSLQERNTDWKKSKVQSR